jgi:arsenate reductase (thioredoxin)
MKVEQIERSAMTHKPKVLFFSTGDTTRSQMAEGFLREFAGDEVVGASTAVKSVEPDPLALEVMREVGVDISGQRPKDIAQFFKEQFAYVVTLCDASTEKFPVWPFSRNIRNWNLVDPERATGTAEQKREAFRQVRDEIRLNVREFLTQSFPQLHAGQGRALAAGSGRT